MVKKGESPLGLCGLRGKRELVIGMAILLSGLLCARE